MTRNSMVAIAALMAILLGACGSTQKTHYYLLQPTEETAVTEKKDYSVGIGPINVAEYLERPQVITIEDNKLLYSDFHRWGESLKDAFTRVVSLNVAAALKNNNIVWFPWRSDEIPDVRIRLDLIELNRVDDQARMTLRWNIDLSSDPSREVQNLETFTVPAEKDGYDSLASAYNELLGKLSTVLAENVALLRSENTPPPK